MCLRAFFVRRYTCDHTLNHAKCQNVSARQGQALRGKRPLTPASRSGAPNGVGTQGVPSLTLDLALAGRTQGNG